MLLSGATDPATPSQSSGSTDIDGGGSSTPPNDVAPSEVNVAPSAQNLNVGTNDGKDSLDQENAPAPENTSTPATSGTIILKVVNLKSEEKDWIFPLEFCKTWPDVHNLIKQAMTDDAVVLEHIANGKFELQDVNGRTIIRQVWGAIVKPGMMVLLRIKSDTHPFATLPPRVFPLPTPFPGMKKTRGAHGFAQELETESNPEDDQAESGTTEFPVYEKEVRHSVEFWNQQHYSSIPDFWFEKHVRGSFTFKHPNKHGKRIPVLQEVVKVTGNRIGRPNPEFNEPTESNPVSITLQPGDKVSNRFLIINSPFLLNVLRAVITYSSAVTPSPYVGGQPYPDSKRDSGDAFKEGRFPFPYRDIYPFKNEICAYKSSHDARKQHSDAENALCDDHIDILIEYLESQDEIRLKDEELRWMKSRPTATFGCLWILLKPGCDVYVHEFGQLNAYVVESVLGGPKVHGRAEPYAINVWNLCFNGTIITREMKTITVPIFDGEREVLSLPLFPTRFYQDEPGKSPLRERLISRGKSYVELAKGPAFREYTGKTEIQSYERARVVVTHLRQGIVTSHTSDSTPGRGSGPGREKSRPPPFPPPPPGYYQQPEKPGSRARAVGCQCQNCQKYQLENQIYVPMSYELYDDINPNKSNDLTDHQYFLCHSHLYAYVLKDRIYDLLDVRGISAPKVNVNAIDQLYMKTESNKTLIKAICRAYRSFEDGEQYFFTDIIQGKGEGHIILLHGPPGTGKTLTAESVAEFTQRPLLTITAADLGHESTALEKNLLTFFRDANDWGAIVLLDEADVYLERRSTQDLERNSIVSVFLRALDYFKGILFLTTNRVGSFDEAFMSRIHVQLGYDSLDEEARLKIWTNYFKKLQQDHEEGGPEIRYEWDAKEYVNRSQEVRALQWNGREIRNAFQTAVGLALHDTKPGAVPVIKESHFRQVVKISQSFKDYITSTHGNMDLADLAYDSGLRNDSKTH